MARPTAQEFVAALRRVEEDGDVEAMARLYADDAPLLTPTERADHVGPDGARRFWDVYRKSFEQVRSRFRAVLESDARIMLEWTSECRTAAGVDTSYDGVSVVETRDGRIVRFAAYFDPAQLVAQPAIDSEVRPTEGAPAADRAPQDEPAPEGERSHAAEAGAEATS